MIPADFTGEHIDMAGQSNWMHRDASKTDGGSTGGKTDIDFLAMVLGKWTWTSEGAAELTVDLMPLGICEIWHSNGTKHDENYHGEGYCFWDFENG